MTRKPVAIALLTCEQAVVEENTHNVTLVNCFVRREQRPAEPITFSVVAFLTDGTGEINLEVVIQSQDNMEVLYRDGRHFQFTNPLNEYRCIFRLRDLPLAVEGSYQIMLLADNELVAQRVIKLTRKGK
jgi:hypothetical protein